MNKPLQKAITEWYKKEHESLIQLNPIRPYEGFVVQIYINEIMFDGTNTPSKIKQLEKFRDFIDDYYDYIYSAIEKVELVMGSTPFNSEFQGKYNFEKVLSIYSSYCQVEDALPGSGIDIIKQYYLNKLK